MSPSNMLELADFTVKRGRSTIVNGVDLAVPAGTCVCLVGSNGAGKTTLVEGLVGTLPATASKFEFDGADIGTMPPWERVRSGLIVVPQERELFPSMTVEENLKVGTFASPSNAGNSIERIYEMFPRLKERSGQAAGTLSGGERGMLAIGRALGSGPKVLVLDEPSLGLAPLIVDQIMAIIRDINEAGITVLLIEQNLHQAFALASQAYLLEQGRVVASGATSELAASEIVREGYLGSTTQMVEG